MLPAPGRDSPRYTTLRRDPQSDTTTLMIDLADPMLHAKGQRHRSSATGLIFGGTVSTLAKGSWNRHAMRNHVRVAATEQRPAPVLEAVTKCAVVLGESA